MRVFRSQWFARFRQMWRVRRWDAAPEASIPPRLMILWTERPDLRAAFDLNREAGRLKAFWWFYCNAFREIGLRYDAGQDGDGDAVNRAIPRYPRHGFQPITWLMRELWYRSGSRSAGSLKTPAAQRTFLAEYFAVRLIAANLGGLLTLDQARILLAIDPDHGQTPRLFTLIHLCDAEIQARFGSPADAAFHRWCREEGGARFPILLHPLIALGRVPRPRLATRPRGINLVGYAHARLGIAEDVRMAAKALAAAGIPFTICNISLGADMAEHEESFDDLLSDELPYDTNLFCMAGPGMVTAMLAEPGRFGQGHRNIGMWPWELPEWPDFWRHAYDLVDEIWAASAFTADAYRRSSPKPIRHLPMAVTVEESEGLTRSDFALPADRFLFAFTFDALSTFARKNPSAVIAAFRTAFPDGTEPVGLVLKGMRAEGDPQWQSILDEIGTDDRVHVVTESMSRGRLLDLYRCIDCFVSLHRSEGFGRNIAECMALGKPVIVTGHSGNMDFTTDETAALVRFDMIRVLPGEYPFGAGQNWADPDANDAARLMRRMVEDDAWRRRIAASGQRLLQERHSPEAVGKLWRHALNLDARPRPPEGATAAEPSSSRSDAESDPLPRLRDVVPDA